MRMQIQPNGWSCYPTALSMVLSVYLKEHKVDEIFTFLRHDGSRLVHPDLRDPNGRLGFHNNELVAYCMAKGFAFCIIDCSPVHMVPTDDGIRTTELGYDPAPIMKSHDAVLWGRFNGYHHAVAWNHVVEKVYDPNGTVYDFKSSDKIEFLALILPLSNQKPVLKN